MAAEVAVITGVTGIVGGAIASAFLEAGARVVAPVRRCAGGWRRLREGVARGAALPRRPLVRHPHAASGVRLSCWPSWRGRRCSSSTRRCATMARPRGRRRWRRTCSSRSATRCALGLAAAATSARFRRGCLPHHTCALPLARWPPQDHCVACVGGMVAMGHLSEVQREGFEAAMRDRVYAQIVLAQALAPLLRASPTSSYTIITGRLGEECTMPSGALFCGESNGARVRSTQWSHGGKRAHAAKDCPLPAPLSSQWPTPRPMASRWRCRASSATSRSASTR